MNKIKLIIGLGNPGKEYEHTRHNSGFLFVNELVRQLDIKNFKYKKEMFSEIAEAEFPISNFQFSKKFKIQNSKFKILLAKPQMFMNESGKAVATLIKLHKAKPENVLIVHDDIDILWGDFKFSFGRSSAGHKGVESVIKVLKTKNFWRLRIGIQPSLKKRVPADKIILKKFTPGELKELDKIMKKAIRQLTPTVPSGLANSS